MNACPVVQVLLDFMGFSPKDSFQFPAYRTGRLFFQRCLLQKVEGFAIHSEERLRVALQNGRKATLTREFYP